MLAGASAKQLRAVLEHLEGCMPALPAIDRQVISMRAGVNGKPMTRPQIGARLGMSRETVRQTERRALNRLQYAAANTNCAGALVGPFDVAGIGNLIPQLLFAGPVRVNGSTGLLAAGSPGPFTQVRGIVDRSASPLFDLGGGGGSGPAWAIILFTVLFSVSIAALTRELRSSF
jgi:DNA-binding CsgD family transcriptional regulator